MLEVRAADRPGVLHLALAALADLDLAVRSAHVDTLGPQAVDVFYLQESARRGALRAAARGRRLRAVARPTTGDRLRGPRVGPCARAASVGLDPPDHHCRGKTTLFATLSDRLADTFKNLRGKGRLSEADIDATAREIRIALLEADVALPVVKEFVAAVKERARGEEVSRALNPAQQIVKIVNEELVDDPRRRDPPAALRQDRPDRDHAGRPPGRRQDDAGGQARAVAQGPGQDADAGRRRPPAPQRGQPAPGQRRAGRRPGLRPRARQRRRRPGRGRPRPRSRRPSASCTTSSSSTPPAASASTPR